MFPVRSSTAAAGFPRVGRRASCCRKLPHQLLKGLPPTQLLTTRPMMSMAGQHEPQPWCTKLVEVWSPSLAPGTLAALAELRDPHAAPTPDVMGFSKFPVLPVGGRTGSRCWAVRRCPVLFAAWHTSCPNAHVHVISDVLCRLVGPQPRPSFCATFPRVRLGTEASMCVLRAATEHDPRATVLSVDAVGAFGHFSR